MKNGNRMIMCGMWTDICGDKFISISICLFLALCLMPHTVAVAVIITIVASFEFRINIKHAIVRTDCGFTIIHFIRMPYSDQGMRG